MKTIPIILISSAICLSMFSGCQKDCHDGQSYNTPIADYLYGVEYDDYEFDECVKYFNAQYIPSDFGCSEVRKGDFVGRNLDWYINRNASAVIKINHTENHFASLGIVGCFPQFSNDLAKTGRYDDVYRFLPFKTEDGVNECGLYVGVNVMPTGETSFDKSSWKPGEFGHGAAGTNPSSDKTYCVNYLPRILLDKAANIDEAKKIIESINWTEPVNYPEDGHTQSFHWLICDANKSVILEFMDNKAVYTESDILNKPSYGTIMTNFTNALMVVGMIQETGIGYERWDILNSNYESTEESFSGMESLMQKVWFSHAYEYSPNPKELWFSEFALDGLPAWDLYKNYELSEDPIFKGLFSLKKKMFDNPGLWYRDDTPLWFTTHTSIYNIRKKELHILVHEGRSGMEEYYDVPFDCHFNKPLRNL